MHNVHKMFIICVGFQKLLCVVFQNLLKHFKYCKKPCKKFHNMVISSKIKIKAMTETATETLNRELEPMD